MRNKPTLRVSPDPARNGAGRVFASDLGVQFTERLSKERSDWLNSIFRVSVLQEGLSDVPLPNVSGRYRLAGDEIEFIPYFPFEGGLKYRATLDLQSIYDGAGIATLDFAFSEKREAAPTEVSRIFPSDDLLPENLLRFHVCFSNSMQRGGAEKHIALLGPDGSLVPDALYRAPVELWDRSMQRLTILLDPGRLKRWVGPNVALGPPIRADQEYTLEIGPGMIDRYGRPLREEFRKTFRVADPIRQPIDIAECGMIRPCAGSRQPFMLTFARLIDWVLLLNAIRIESVHGVPIAGKIGAQDGEQTWSFTPTSPWTDQTYHVRLAATLEDVCGNCRLAPFERPIRPDGGATKKAKDYFFAFHPLSF